MKEVVIKMPDEMYDWFVNGFPDKVDLDELQRLVINGTVLPEGHGDLIDRSKLVPDCYELEIHDGDDWRNEYCGVSLMQIEEYAEVIVKADKENRYEG